MPPTGKTFLAAPTFLPGAGVITSPFQYVLTGNEFLAILAVNSVAGVVLNIQARYLDSKGNVNEARWQHTPLSNRSTTAEFYPLQAGALLSLIVFANVAGIQEGQTYVQIFLSIGKAPSQLLVGQLLGGYVTANRVLGWPGTPIQQSTDGAGAILTTVDASPAAGTQYISVVPVGARWELLRFTFGFTSSAAVANRVMRFRIRDHGTDIIAITLFPTQVTATQTWFFTCAGNLPSASDATSGTQQAATPAPTILRNTQQFETSIFNLQAADQILTPAFTVREWLEVN